MERIKKLRLEALEKTACYDEFYYRFYKHYFTNKNQSAEERYGEAFYSAFSGLRPSISADELIVGKCVSSLTSAEGEEWKKTYLHLAEKEVSEFFVGQDSHMAIDYELLLSSGINGVIAKTDNYIKNCQDDEKIAFYKMCRRCLEAVVRFSKNYADFAKKLSEKETNEKKRKELEKISEICRKVPANPAESFYEAVQSVHFISFCLSMNPFRLCSQQFQLGHPDRYLLPYYKNDIEKGIITKEYALLLLDCLGIQINNRVPNGLSSGYLVGGRDKDNNIVSNELTWMLMQVVDDIRLVYPAVGLCYTDGMDEAYLEQACKIISKGCSHPAIFNDDIITKGLMSYGIPEEEAHNYIHSTCVEITPVASSNVWVASPYTNMAQLLLDALGNEYENFDDLMKELFSALDKSIKINFENMNEARKIRSEKTINPLLSCFVNDCLERGTDIEKGGARYNWIMPSFVGMANLVDSLFAIKKTVFEKKEISIAKLKSILDKNFEGEEVLRQKLLDTIPKYGNDIDEVDCLFGEISEHIISECKKYNGMHSNGNLIPSVFCWVMHERFGVETGATPDGRKAGFPLGDGSGPCQGREMKGPTASILSSTKWKHHEFIGGVAVNMKFSRKLLGAQSQNIMKSLIKTYLRRGGFEIQINVTDRETLEKAIKSPDEYKDIVVRVGGYSDYFVKLSPQMQQEILLRTEHQI